MVGTLIVTAAALAAALRHGGAGPAGMLAGMRPLPAPFDAIAAGRPASIALAGPALLGSRLLTKDLAFSDAERDAFQLRGFLPDRDPDDRRADRARARAPAAQGRPARALHRAGRAPGSQRDAVLPRRSPSTSRSSCRSSTRRRSGGRARSSATSSAGRAGRGSRRPTATGSRSSSARARTWTSGSSSSPTTSGSSGWAIRAPAGWPSRSASSPCTRRAGSIRRSRCRSRSTSGPTIRRCSTTRCTSAIGRLGCGARPTTRWSRRSSRASRRSGRAASSSGRTSSSTTRCASSTATGTACRPSTTTSRGPPPSWSPACWPACAASGRASPTRGSCSSERARRASASRACSVSRCSRTGCPRPTVRRAIVLVDSRGHGPRPARGPR